MSDEYEKGLQVFGEVYGAAARDALVDYHKSGAFGCLQAKWSMDWVFGVVWARDELPRKMRSCATLGMLIALGAEKEIKYHTRMGLANGLTPKEIEEIYYTSIPYCGLPVSNIAKTAILEALTEAGEIGGFTKENL